MKKLFYFLSFSVLFLSCGGEDNTPYDPNAIQSTTLLKKKVESFDDGPPITTTYHYNGFKIANYTDNNGGSAVFTYSGNLIEKIEYFDGTVLLRTDLFTYNAQNKVATHVALLHPEDFGMREVFTHNANGSASYTTFFGTVTEQNTPDQPGKLFFANGEIIKKETYIGSAPASSETYQYDNWNNPLKNVIGLNQAYAFSGKINGIQKVLLSTSGTTNPRAITYQYDLYSRFPTASSSISALEGGVETQYVYE